jgi:DnaA family protein
MPYQRGLPFSVSVHQTFERFITGANAELVGHLERLTGIDLMWIWGQPDSGKTHLLHATCNQAGGNECQAGYLPMHGLPIEGIEGYDHCDLLAFDDLDSWLGELDREQAILGLYEALRSQQKTMLVTAAESPLELTFALPDLASRMRSASVFHLLPLTDEDKCFLLIERAADRGLRLNPDVAGYWVSRAPRRLGDLLAGLDQLDAQSLSAGRRLTKSFVKEVLNL